MGFLEGLESLIGAGDVQRLAGGQGDFQNPNSPDQQRMQAMVAHADPQQAEQAFTQTARQLDPQDYSQHLNASGDGANPLGKLGSGALGTIASLLVQHLSASGSGLGSVLQRIPGLQTSDPNQMNANQVAALAQYTQQHQPDVFGRVAAQLGQQQPDLLHSFLGKAGLAIGAAALASHFVKMDHA